MACCPILKIEIPTYGWLDLEVQDENLAITYTSRDLLELDTIATAFSKEVTVSCTAQNDQLLRKVYRLDSTDDVVKDTFRYNAILEVDGFAVIKGFGFVTFNRSVVSSDGTLSHTFAVVDEQLFEVLNKPLCELDLGSHDLEETIVMNSWDRNGNRDFSTDVVYGSDFGPDGTSTAYGWDYIGCTYYPVHRGRWSRDDSVPGRDLIPNVYLKWIFSRAFSQGTNYRRIKSALMDTVEFEGLTIPSTTQGVGTLSDDDFNRLSFAVGDFTAQVVAPAPNATETVYFPSFSNSMNAVPVPAELAGNCFTAAFPVSMGFRYTGTLTVAPDIPNITPPTDETYTIIVEILNGDPTDIYTNGTVLASQEITGPFFAGSIIPIELNTTNVCLSTVTNNEQVCVRYRITRANNTAGQQAFFIGQGILEGKPNKFVVCPGTTVNLADSMPCDVTFGDLVRSITIQYNLQWAFDPKNSVLYFDSDPSFYDCRVTDKNIQVDCASAVEYASLREEATRFKFKYKEDSNDEWLAKNFPPDYLSGTYEPIEGATSEEEYEDPVFAPTIDILDLDVSIRAGDVSNPGQKRNAPYWPRLWKEDTETIGTRLEESSYDFTPRILYYGGIRDYSDYVDTSYGFRYHAFDGTDQELKWFPHAWMVNPITPGEISLGYGDANITRLGISDIGKISRFWKPYLNLISRNRVLSFIGRLNIEQFSEPKFRSGINISIPELGKASLRLLEIADYNPCTGLAAIKAIPCREYEADSANALALLPEPLDPCPVSQLTLIINSRESIWITGFSSEGPTGTQAGFTNGYHRYTFYLMNNPDPGLWPSATIDDLATAAVNLATVTTTVGLSLTPGTGFTTHAWFEVVKNTLNDPTYAYPVRIEHRYSEDGIKYSEPTYQVINTFTLLGQLDTPRGIETREGDCSKFWIGDAGNQRIVYVSPTGMISALSTTATVTESVTQMEYYKNPNEAPGLNEHLLFVNDRGGGVYRIVYSTINSTDGTIIYGPSSNFNVDSNLNVGVGGVVGEAQIVPGTSSNSEPVVAVCVYDTGGPAFDLRFYARDSLGAWINTDLSFSHLNPAGADSFAQGIKSFDIDINPLTGGLRIWCLIESPRREIVLLETADSTVDYLVPGNYTTTQIHYTPNVGDTCAPGSVTSGVGSPGTLGVDVQSLQILEAATLTNPWPELGMVQPFCPGGSAGMVYRYVYAGAIPFPFYQRWDLLQEQQISSAAVAANPYDLAACSPDGNFDAAQQLSKKYLLTATGSHAAYMMRNDTPTERVDVVAGIEADPGSTLSIVV